MKVSVLFIIFFFQAEDGIRDYKVTGVQTCALPISPELAVSHPLTGRVARRVLRSLDLPIQLRRRRALHATTARRAAHAACAAVPQRRRAPLFERARRQGLEEARDRKSVV